MRKAFAALTSFATVLAIPPAMAGPGDPIGSAARVVSLVTAELDRAERTLVTNDAVRQNELIAVSDNGLGELVLADETKLALGPGARLTLDKFVYDPEKSGGAIVLNMTRGAFRFVTGQAKKPAYVIRTPSASITVRGTIFDVYVEDGGAIWMLLHEGAVQVCNDRGECRVLDDPCRLVRVDGDGGVGVPGHWNGLRRGNDIDFETAFPFVISPPGIDPEPHFLRASIETGSCAGNDQPIRPKYQRAEPAKPRYVPPKVLKAERYVPPKRKVVAYAPPVYVPPPPRYDPPSKLGVYTPPKKPKVVVYNPPPPPKYDPPKNRKIVTYDPAPKYDPPKKKKVVIYDPAPKYDAPKKKVVTYDPAPKYDPPKKKKVVIYDQPQKKYPKKDYPRRKNNDGAVAAKVLGAAVVFGLLYAASKAGKKNRGYNY